MDIVNEDDLKVGVWQNNHWIWNFAWNLRLLKIWLEEESHDGANKKKEEKESNQNGDKNYELKKRIYLREVFQ